MEGYKDDRLTEGMMMKGTTKRKEDLIDDRRVKG